MVSKFILRISLFLAPIVLPISFLEWKLYTMGETLSVDNVLTIQIENDEEIKFMRGVISQDYNIYKYQGINRNAPEVMVIGSSRVMKFRNFHFADSSLFYNAGGIIQCGPDIIQFVERIKSGDLKRPKVIIVGIDPWWFKQDSEPTKSWLTDDRLKDHAVDYTTRLSSYIRLLKSWEQTSQSNILEFENIGIYAKVYGGGFRSDGSKSVEQHIINEYIANPGFVDRETPPVSKRIKEGLTNRFSPSPPDPEMFYRVLNALKQLQELDIAVIAYCPPLSSQSYALLESSNMHREWWHFIQSITIPALERELDYTIPIEYPLLYGLKDDYFLDGFHPGEVFVGIQLQEHARKSELLRSFINPDLDEVNEKTFIPLIYRQ